MKYKYYNKIKPDITLKEFNNLVDKRQIEIHKNINDAFKWMPEMDFYDGEILTDQARSFRWSDMNNACCVNLPNHHGWMFDLRDFYVPDIYDKQFYEE